MNTEAMPIICVACPKGCRLEVLRKDGEILVNNAGCKRGQEYARGEVTDPRRMVASTVRIADAIHPLLPVYTAAPFPKGKIKELLAEIRTVRLHAPIKMNQVIIENVLGTHINVVASRDLD